MALILELISYLLSLLSPKGLDNLARAITFVSWDLLKIRRKLILSNLATAFGSEKSEEERLKVAKLSVYHFVLTALEFLAERNGDLGKKVQIVSGEEHLQATMNDGQGIYILCIHMGSWEAMGGGLNRLGYPSHVIVKKVGSESTDRFVKKLRSKNGFQCIQRKSKGDAVKGIIRILKKGQIVGFVMDQARPGEPFLPFFDRPAKTNTSFAAILRKIKAPVVPAYIVRKGVFEHEIHVLPPVNLNFTDNAEQDILEHSGMFNSIVEGMIRACPEQYFWMHNRWKS